MSVKVDPAGAIPIDPSSFTADVGVDNNMLRAVMAVESMPNQPVSDSGTPQRSRAEMRLIGTVISWPRFLKESTAISISDAAIYCGSKAAVGGL